MPVLASPKAKKKSKHDREIEIEKGYIFDVRGDFLALQNRGCKFGYSSESNLGLKLALQDRRISMRLSGMKLTMLLAPMVLLNPIGRTLLNLTKRVPG